METIHVFTVLIHQEKNPEVCLVLFFLINAAFEMREQRASSAEQSRPDFCCGLHMVPDYSKHKNILSPDFFLQCALDIFPQYSVSRYFL